MINGESILRERYDNLNDDQYQPAGIDLTLGNLYTLEENNLDIYGLFKNMKILPEQCEMSTRNVLVKGNLCKVYTLDPKTAYIAKTNEKIKIDQHSAQFYLPRSSLLRAGISVQTALGDPGFNGHLSFLIVNHTDAPFMIEKHVRFAQLIDVACSGIEKEYDGDYNEN